MEKKKEVSNISQKKKWSTSQLSAKSFDTSDTKDYRKLSPTRSLRKSKNSTIRKYPKNSTKAKEDVERSDDNIEKINHYKENKLLNLIVKIIVRSTLNQLYGKESY